MVKQIVKDQIFLQQKSEPATEADAQVIVDLMDTLKANLDRCVGMAANMIGVKKQIIVVAAGPFVFPMVNPVITKKSGRYETEESCLSLDGVRPCVRYDEIEVDIWTRISSLSMENIADLQLRLFSTKFSISVAS